MWATPVDVRHPAVLVTHANRGYDMSPADRGLRVIGDRRRPPSWCVTFHRLAVCRGRLRSHLAACLHRGPGRWHIAPAGPIRATRRRTAATVVAWRRFRHDDGTVRLIDFMPRAPGADVCPARRGVRAVRCGGPQSRSTTPRAALGAPGRRRLDRRRRPDALVSHPFDGAARTLATCGPGQRRRGLPPPSSSLCDSHAHPEPVDRNRAGRD